jgi:hypothetical protein
LFQLAGEPAIGILFGRQGENHRRLGALGGDAEKRLEERGPLAVDLAARMILTEGKGPGHIEHQFVQKDQGRLIAKGFPQVSTSRSDALFVVLAHLLIASEAPCQQCDLPSGGIGANPSAVNLKLLPPKWIRLLPHKHCHSSCVMPGKPIDPIIRQPFQQAFALARCMNGRDQGM